MIWNREPRVSRYIHWPGTMDVDVFRYTPGASGKVFAENLKKGVIVGEDCGEYVQVPPRGFCMDLSKPRGYREIPSDAVWSVDTYTIIYEDGEPVVYVFAKPEGEGFIGGLVHKLKKGSPVYIGMPVKPVFKAEQDRNGTLEDIMYFEEYY